MIVVRVELHHATEPGKVTELARMEIANNDGGGRKTLRSYIARTLFGRCTAQLNTRRPQRETEIKYWPSERLHIWNLVTTALRQMGYGDHRKSQVTDASALDSVTE